jgi:hypothetical protein
MEIHRRAANNALRRLALSGMLRVSGRERAIPYLRQVAESDDVTAESAVTALIVDVYGDANGATPTEKAASNRVLRELYDRGTVKDEYAKRALASWAGTQGWRR